jgi:hypothetical protein
MTTGVSTDVSVDTPTHLPAPASLEATGLRLDLVVQLIVKSLHFAGELSGIEMSHRMALPFPAIEPAIDALKAQRLCEIVGGTNVGPPSYRYRITTLGRERAATFLAGNMYAGEAPVPFDQYRRYMTAFAAAVPGRISPEDVASGFSHLVLSRRVLTQLGPAVNSGHSLFIYGPPGNGKTVIAQAIRELLKGDILIPHTIEVDGSIIKVFDPINHDAFAAPKAGPGLEVTDAHDRRWVRCRRPAVTVGGELTMEALDLVFSTVTGYYHAPMQLLANGGVLVVDDFGRQRCSPQALLNRWIHPLETRVDYLTLQSGQKIDVPFLVLPVFATNIKPAELVDEAFLRRIQYKVFAENPTPEEYARIFENVCREREVAFDPAVVGHLLDNVLGPRRIPLRGCQPRDLIGQALSLAQYLGDPPVVTVPLLEAACATYFVDEDQGVPAAR